MDSDRPNRTLSTTSSTSINNNELFICFTSRLSSSSMKLSSKSILSPGRTRDPPNISLSTSLSRRLRTNGSMKGGQASPMFPTGGKKRGSAFENPEPSSPKVTCIGQVRVKTKKQGKKMRTLSRRQGGEVSFRKLEQGNRNQNHEPDQRTNASIQNQYQQQQVEGLPHRNQRWVHLPLTICEALRTFGAEFSCLFPCRPSCFSTTAAEREKEEKAAVMGSSDGDGQSSCGAVFARWLVALQESEGGGKERDIELVVGEEDEDEDVNDYERRVRNSRRHVFDELEINDETCDVKNEVVGEEEESRRVSVSVPPKNALLLMRCRSDPNKMAALANRFWESPVVEEEENCDKEVEYEDDKDEQEQAKIEEVKDDVEMKEKIDEVLAKVDVIDVNEEEKQRPEAETNLYVEVQDNNEDKSQEVLHIKEEEEEEELLLLLLEEPELEEREETEVHQTVLEEANTLSGFLIKACEDEEIKENGDNPIQNNEEENRGSSSSSSSVVNLDKVDGETEEEESLVDKAALDLETEESTREKVTEDDEEIATHERSDPGDEEEEEEEEEEGSQAEERESVIRENQQERESTMLPDCLLMMMCEPKLSMEVSKETWVCSTDFIRWPPKKVVKPIDGGDDEFKNRVGIDSDSNPVPAMQSVKPKPQPLELPPRSSCSLPAPAAAATGISMATMLEQKLVNAVGYEPFVLTRCKSAPMRTASKLAPDTCFWKNRNLEPHRRSNFGVGAAGIGF